MWSSIVVSISLFLVESLITVRGLKTPPIPDDRFEQTDKPLAVFVQTDGRIQPNGPFCYSKHNHTVEKYMLMSAAFNRKWMERFPGHRYYLFAGSFTPPDARTSLSQVWGKVYAMREAMRRFPSAQYFLFVDTDVMISPKFYYNTSLIDIFNRIDELYPPKNGIRRDIIVNQDAKSAWCDMVVERRPDFKYCLNSGTLMWRRSPESQRFFDAWWNSSLDPEPSWLSKFRTEWPWEQDRLMAIANDRQHPQYKLHHSHLLVVPEPESVSMSWKVGDGPYQGRFCLSHLPEADCMFQHWCANSTQKHMMGGRISRLLGHPESTMGMCSKFTKDPLELKKNGSVISFE